MKHGKILLVGFGPGAAEHMSYRAREAIAEADVVIGYSTYVKLVQDQLDGKLVIRKGMTEELDRSIEAYEHARQGKIVALISSGDIGVYGMAGPTFEVLLQSGWKPGDGIEIEVVPGSTALSACASLVGAPLTHDFCSISLSDLLTPWPVIARRLEGAGSGDFVVALYNPKSGRRTQQIVEAQRILLRYRSPETPVAIVKSAYREKQNIKLTTLSAMADHDIGMLTTVLIGNSSTFMREGLMITPRGYASKYDVLTGEIRDGEKAGRSLSMGLLGWKSCVRRYLRDTPDATLNQATEYFNVVPGEILAAIAEATADDTAGEHRAAAVGSDQLPSLLAACACWGKLRAVVRNAGNAVVEALITSDELIQKGDWLNVVNERFHLHIPWSTVAQAFFSCSTDRSAGVYFVDASGQLIFRLLLTKQGNQFAQSTLDAFNAAWTELSTPHNETADHE